MGSSRWCLKAALVWQAPPRRVESATTLVFTRTIFLTVLRLGREVVLMMVEQGRIRTFDTRLCACTSIRWRRSAANPMGYFDQPGDHPSCRSSSQSDVGGLMILKMLPSGARRRA
jgi:hypothetical protein